LATAEALPYWSIYAGARNPQSITMAGVDWVRPDVTNPDSVAAARQCSDINLLINNAGISLWKSFGYVRAAELILLGCEQPSLD